MLFNSFEYLFIFLVLTFFLAKYFFKLRIYILITSSLFFAQTAINHFQYISVYFFGFLVFIVPFIYSSINKKKINNVFYLYDN